MKRVIEEIISDISGKPGATTTMFALDGVNYTIDLAPDERATLDQLLSRFVNNATVVRRPAGVTKATKSTKAATGHAKTARPDLTEMRKWLAANGYQVQPKGRIAGHLVAAYEARIPNPNAPTVAVAEAPAATPPAAPKKAAQKAAPAARKAAATWKTNDTKEALVDAVTAKGGAEAAAAGGEKTNVVPIQTTTARRSRAKKAAADAPQAVAQ